MFLQFHLDGLNGWGDIGNFWFPIWRMPTIRNLNCNLHIPAKFRLDLLNGCGYIANLPFSIWWSPAILNVWNMQFLTLRTVYSQICLFIQNFITIGWTVAEISRFSDFQYGGRPPFRIFEIFKISLSARFTMAICMFVLYGHDLLDHAKFRRDWMNDCRDIAIFRFPIWRPSAILDF